MTDEQKEADKSELDELDKDKDFFKAYHTAFFNNLDFQKSPYNFAKELWRLCLEHATTLKFSLPTEEQVSIAARNHKKEWGSGDNDESFKFGVNWLRHNIKLIPQEKLDKIYRVFCQSMHKVEYTLGYFDSKYDAQRLIDSNFKQTASGPHYGIEEITIIKEIKEKPEDGI